MATCFTTTPPARAASPPSRPIPRCCVRVSGGSSSGALPTPGATCSTRTSRSSQSSAGKGSSRLPDVIEPAATCDAPPLAEQGRVSVWLLALLPLALITLAIGVFLALDEPGLGDRRGPAVEQLAVE